MNESTLQQSIIPDIYHTIEFNAPIQKVWKAISTSDGITQWHMPNTFKPELGAEFTFSSQPMQDWDGIIHSRLVEINPPYKLSYTWSTNVIKEELIVTFELHERGDKTELHLSHTGWSKCSSDKLIIRNLLDKGWASQGIENLKKVMEG